MMGMLLPLGIEKGKDFMPDAATVAQLKSAAAEAHAWLLAQLPTFTEDWWPGSQWKVPVAPVAVKTGFKWTVADYFDVERVALPLPASSCLPRSSEQAASISALASIIVVNRSGATKPIACTFLRMCL